MGHRIIFAMDVLEGGLWYGRNLCPLELQRHFFNPPRRLGLGYFRKIISRALQSPSNSRPIKSLEAQRLSDLAVVPTLPPRFDRSHAMRFWKWFRTFAKDVVYKFLVEVSAKVLSAMLFGSGFH